VVSSGKAVVKDYYILRGQPKEPKSGFQMRGRKDSPKASPKGMTIYGIPWDTASHFQNTQRAVSIDACRLLDERLQDVVHLSRHGQVWAASDRARPSHEVVSIGLDKSKLRVEFRDEQPVQLETRIAYARKQLNEKERIISDWPSDPNEPRLKTDDRKKKEEDELESLKTTLNTLELLQAIHSSRIKVLITWTVDGHRFKIVPLEEVTSD
jgi:hypothetical protein